MKSFVLVYERATGNLVIHEYAPGHRAEAFKERLRLEKIVEEGTEVSVFHADSLEEIHRTHGRYFKTAKQMAEEGATVRP